MITIAIAGLITSGITMTISQIFNINTISGNHMVVIRQVQNAGYWISRDTQMAQNIVTGDDPAGTGFPLALTWTDWETGDVHHVVYTLDGSLELRRDYDGQGIRVAQYIDTASIIPSGGNFTLTITAELGTASETRTYDITPRPNAS